MLLVLSLLACGTGDAKPSDDRGGETGASSDTETGDTDSGDTDSGDTDSGGETDTATDADGDGSAAGVDCDDADPGVFPGAPEHCDDADEDCDGEVDEGAVDAPTWYADVDGDGYGNATDAGRIACDAPPGTAASADDCDDASALANPGMPEEICGDGVDNDCDGAAVGCALNGAIDLADAPVKLTGEHAEDRSGLSISAAGDVDADGYPDLLIGSLTSDDGGPNAGAAHLVRGPLTADMNLSAAEAELIGEDQDDEAGCAVAGVGDVDADGYDDLFVGAFQDDDAGVDAGAAYLVYGPVSGDLDLSLADAKLTAEHANDEAGRGVAGAGDVNADGYPDLLVGAHWSSLGGALSGTVYLVDGPVAGPVGLGDATARLYGIPYEEIGNGAINTAGDVDGDGYADLLIGSPYDDDGGNRAGAAYLVYGPVSGDLAVALADAKLVGEVEDARTGSAVASAGDVDGDGHVDLVIGAMDYSTGADRPGMAYLVSGPVTGVLSLSAATARMEGVLSGDAAGCAVAGGGDVDADGYADLLIGATDGNEGGSDSGAAYLVRGPVSGTFQLSLATATFAGEDIADGAGASVAFAGDVDLDGYTDVLIGADGDDDLGGSSGASYLLFGGPGE